MEIDSNVEISNLKLQIEHKEEIISLNVKIIKEIENTSQKYRIKAEELELDLQKILKMCTTVDIYLNELAAKILNCSINIPNNILLDYECEEMFPSIPNLLHVLSKSQLLLMQKDQVIKDLNYSLEKLKKNSSILITPQNVPGDIPDDSCLEPKFNQMEKSLYINESEIANLTTYYQNELDKSKEYSQAAYQHIITKEKELINLTQCYQEELKILSCKITEICTLKEQHAIEIQTLEIKRFNTSKSLKDMIFDRDSKINSIESLLIKANMDNDELKAALSIKDQTIETLERKIKDLCASAQDHSIRIEDLIIKNQDLENSLILLRSDHSENNYPKQISNESINIIQNIENNQILNLKNQLDNLQNQISKKHKEIEELLAYREKLTGETKYLHETILNLENIKQEMLISQERKNDCETKLRNENFQLNLSKISLEKKIVKVKNRNNNYLLRIKKLKTKVLSLKKALSPQPSLIKAVEIPNTSDKKPPALLNQNKLIRQSYLDKGAKP